MTRSAASPRLAHALRLAIALISLSIASCGIAGATAAREALPSGESPPAAAAGKRQATIDGDYTVLACGDILLSRTPGKRAAEFGYRHLFEGIKSLVSSADVAFANIETPASYLGAPYPGKPDNVTFRADPATLFGVAWAGFDAVSLANNHINDYGPRAVGETLDFIDLLGIARCGAGRNLEEARNPAMVERNGIIFAFLGYAEPAYSVVEAKSSVAAPSWTRSEERRHGPIPPAAYTGRGPDSARSSSAGVAPAVLSSIVSDIKRLKSDMKPDYILVSIHWGDEHQHIPNKFQRMLGRAAIDAGATAVLGHHPHVLQSIERYHGGLIAYSLGNLVFDMAADHTYETAALRLVVSSGRLTRADVIPLRIERGVYAPSPATAADAATRLEELRLWSARFDTEIIINSGFGSIFF